MISVTTPLRGRLGNHLFQIGAICSYAKAHNYRALFSWESSGNEARNKSLLLQNIEFVRNEELEKFSRLEHNFFNFKELPTLINSTYISGKYCFFQDLNYLNRDLMLELFLIPSLKNEVRLKYPDIENRTSVHIRRGDYIRREKIGSNQFVIPGVKYYKNALKICQSDKVIIFSDDVEWCRRKFKCENVIFSKDNEDLSLTAMTMCRNNILSASTFGWWGAYLNIHKDKKVVAPKTWFKTDSVEVTNKLTTIESSLIPESWIRIESHQNLSPRIGLRLKKLRRSLFKR